MNTKSPNSARRITLAAAALGLAATVVPQSPTLAANARKPRSTTTSTLPAPPSTRAATTTTEKARGKITVGTIGDILGLDPANTVGDLTLQGPTVAIYDQLVDTPYGKNPQPMLAESFTESADRKSWTLKIRSGVKFHDGTSLTAEAVKVNMERHRKARTTGPSMALIKSIDIVDPMTIRLVLDKPYGSLPYLLSGNVGTILSPKVLQEKADVVGTKPTDAGTGPYVLKEWVPGDHVTVVANPNYWGTPKPRLDQITFKTIPDETSRLAALEAGDVQSIVATTPQTADRAAKAGFNIATPPTQGSIAIFLNNSKPPFNDVRMRRAAALAVDTRAVVRLFAVSDAQAEASYRNLSFGLWPKDNPWYSAAGPELDFDSNAARTLVRDYVNSTGRDPVFTMVAASASGQDDYLRLIAKYLSATGMTVKIVAVPDINAVIGVLATGQFEATVFGVGLSKDPDATAYPLLLSNSPGNFSRYKSAEMDAALEEGRTTFDPAARKAAYGKVQELFRRDVPLIIGPSGSFPIISSKKICGIDPTQLFSSKTVGLGNC